MLDRLVTIFIESVRKPEPEHQSRGWIAHNKTSAYRAIDVLEAEAGDLADTVDIGRIAIALALAFLNQHFPDENWRPPHLYSRAGLTRSTSGHQYRDRIGRF